ncbi:hypothetical protein OAS39_07815 [Pirellulales bacterium]|nr:hypothetical protein [Pirellulales bacterium]
MKFWIVFLNVVAAAGFVFLGSIASAIHSAHTYSTYHEFVVIGAINEEELETLKDPASPEETRYDLRAKIQQAGNVETWLTRISSMAAVVCVLNAVAVQLLMKEHKQSDGGSPSKCVISVKTEQRYCACGR